MYNQKYSCLPTAWFWKTSMISPNRNMEKCFWWSTFMDLLRLYDFNLSSLLFLSVWSTLKGYESDDKSKVLLKYLLLANSFLFWDLRNKAYWGRYQCRIQHVFSEYSTPDSRCWDGIFRSFSDKDDGLMLICFHFPVIIL